MSTVVRYLARSRQTRARRGRLPGRSRSGRARSSQRRRARRRRSARLPPRREACPRKSGRRAEASPPPRGGPGGARRSTQRSFGPVSGTRSAPVLLIIDPSPRALPPRDAFREHDRLPCSAPLCPAVPCPALPCPAPPCRALPRPALPRPRRNRGSHRTPLRSAGIHPRRLKKKADSIWRPNGCDIESAYLLTGLPKRRGAPHPVVRCWSRGRSASELQWPAMLARPTGACKNYQGTPSESARRGRRREPRRCLPPGPLSISMALTQSTHSAGASRHTRLGRAPPLFRPPRSKGEAMPLDALAGT